MAKIERSDYISDGAIDAPILMAKNLEKLVDSINKVVKAGKESNVILEQAENTKTLSKETKNYATRQSELEAIDKRIQKQMVKNNDEVIKREVALKKLRDQTKDLKKAEEDRQKELKGQLGTEEKLRKSNKELRIERKKLNVETEKGAKRLAEINAKIDENTSNLKGLSDSYTQQKMEIGDYRGQLEGLFVTFQEASGAEGGMANLFGTITGGLGDATKASLRFIATPIGAIIFAIVAAVGALGAAFTSNAEGAKFFNEVMSGIGDVLDFLLGRFAMVGNAIIKLLSGDFQGAADTATKAITGLGKGIKDAYNEGVAYEKLLRKIKDVTAEVTVNVAKYQSQLDILNQRAGDATISLNEQNKAALKAASAQVKLTTEKLRLLDLEEEKAERNWKKAKKNRSDDIKDMYQLLQEATAARIDAESEQTLAIKENATLRRKIRQDEGELYLDFLIDNFDNVKTINERIIANEEKALEERKKLLDETARLGEQSFKNQIDLLQEFTDETIRADELLSMVDGKQLFEAAEALGLSEQLNTRLLEVIRERRLVLQDLQEAQDSLIQSTEKLGEIDLEMPDVEQTNYLDQLALMQDMEQMSYDRRLQMYLNFQKALVDAQGLSEDEKLAKHLEYQEKIDEMQANKEDERLDAHAERQQAIQDVIVMSITETANIVKELTQRELDTVNRQLENLEERKEHELELAGRNAAEKQRIEEEFFAEEQALEAERRKLLKRQAIADKAIAITQAVIGTAQGITNALKIQPAPLGIALASVIGGLGAAQIATIATQPIPQFAKGTEDSPEGLAVVNEEGGELMERNGKYSMVESQGAALTYLKKGTKIHTAAETQEILASGVSGGISMQHEKKTEMYNTGLIVSGLKDINRSIKKQKQLHINTTKQGVETMLKNGQNYHKLINSEFK